MVAYPFAEYRPDLASFDPRYSDVIKNVLAKASGYGPMPQIVAYSNAAAARAVGYIGVHNTSTKAFSAFMATSNKLYKFNSTTKDWDDVSRASAYTGTSGYWDFCQFGNYVVAANGTDNVQVYELGVSSVFADLGGSPPAAARCTVIGDQLCLYGISDNTLRLSGINDITHWTPPRKRAVTKQFPSGGDIQFVSSGQNGAIILQERTKRQLTMLPSSPLVFSTVEFDAGRGAVSSFGCAQLGDSIFYTAEDGFYMLRGGQSVPIGAEKVDRTFLDDVDQTVLADALCNIDPVNKIAWYAYSTNNANAYFDKMLGYDWQLERWVLVEQNVEYLAQIQVPGISLDDIPTEFPSYNLDTLPFSLDSRILNGGRPVMAAFDTSHQLGFFEGTPLEATLETNDIQMTPGRWTFVSGFRPLIDATGVYGRTGVKKTYDDTRTWKSEVLASTATGYIRSRANGLLHRYRVRIPVGTSWNDAVGIADVLSRPSSGR